MDESRTETETEPVNDCCIVGACPIETCHSQDIAGWHAKDGMNLFCCCCGRFWKGTDEEVKEAWKREEEDAEI